MAAMATSRLILPVDPTAYGNDDAWRNLKAPGTSTKTPARTQRSLSSIDFEQRSALDFPDQMEASLPRRE